MLILCIKGRLAYGLTVALYDLEKRQHVGPDLLVLEKSGKPEIFVRQLAKAIEQLEGSGKIVGIMKDLRDLCDQHEIPLNVEWKTYVMRK